MAITKIKNVKTNLKYVVDYICDKSKTDGEMLISSFGCTPQTADIEFGMTQSYARGQNIVLARHMIQSFKENEVTPEQAHEIGKKLAERFLGSKYEYVLSTHIDKQCLHNHLVFNNVSFIDNRCCRILKNTYKDIRNMSDDICCEYGLSVIKPSGNRGKSYTEYNADKSGTSWKSKLRITIDKLIPISIDFDDFLRRMQEAGYEVKSGKYISFRAKDQERFTRSKTLGDDYTEEAIRDRIAAPKIEIDTINSLIDIENSTKAKQSRGYEHWSKLYNLKQSAKTMNFLTANNIANYEQLTTKVTECRKSFNEISATLKTAEKRLNDMGNLIKDIQTYKQTKSTYEKYQKSGNQTEFRGDILLHERSMRAIKKALNVKSVEGESLPDLTTLRAEYMSLSEHKNQLYDEYKKIRDTVNEYDILKSNIDSILRKGDHVKTEELE